MARFLCLGMILLALAGLGFIRTFVEEPPAGDGSWTWRQNLGV